MKFRTLFIVLVLPVIFMAVPAWSQVGAQLEWKPRIFGFKPPMKLFIGSNGAGIGWDSPILGTPIGDFSLNITGSISPVDMRGKNSSNTGPRTSTLGVEPAKLIVYIDGNLKYTSTLRKSGDYKLRVEKGLTLDLSRVLKFDGANLSIYLKHDLALQKAEQGLRRADRIIKEDSGVISRQQYLLNDNQATIAEYKEKIVELRRQRDEGYRAAQDVTRQARERGDKNRYLAGTVLQFERRISVLEAENLRLRIANRASGNERNNAFVRTNPSPSDSGQIDDIRSNQISSTRLGGSGMTDRDRAIVARRILGLQR